jgi:hypothetical protein
MIIQPKRMGKRSVSMKQLNQMRAANHGKLSMKESARIRRILKKHPPEWNIYFTNANLRLIQVMKDRKKANQNIQLRGADSGVKGFKGPNWHNNVFNPYSKTKSNSIMSQNIKSYKSFLPKLDKRGPKPAELQEYGEDLNDESPSQSVNYGDQAITESDYVMPPSQPSQVHI